MPRLDKTGPLGDGSKKGRKLGICKKDDMQESLEKLGKGMEMKKRSGGGKGRGKRLKSNLP